MDTEKFNEAFNKIINSAVNMAAPLLALSKAIDEVSITMSARLNPVIREWQREQNRRRLQDYLNTRAPRGRVGSAAGRAGLAAVLSPAANRRSI